MHKLNAIAKRTVRTGQYESFEISTMAEIEPDPKYTARENVRALNQLVVNEVNSMVDQVRKQFEQEASR